MRLELRSREYVHPGCDDDPAPIGFLVPVGIPDPGADDEAHPEDAFLSELGAFLRRGYRVSAAERACVRELARDALDLVDGPDGDFSALPVRRWLARGVVAGAGEGLEPTRVPPLAVAFVTFLRVSGRVAPGVADALRNAVGGVTTLDSRELARAA